MVLSELSFLSLKIPGRGDGLDRRWGYSSYGGGGGGGMSSSGCSSSNFVTNYYTSSSSNRTLTSTSTSCSRMTRSTTSCSSSSSSSCFGPGALSSGGRRFVESTPILKVMELLGSLRWIFLLILLTDSVIGHASDGSGGGMNRNPGASSPSSSSSLSSSSGSTSFSLSPPMAGGLPGGGGGGGSSTSISSSVNSNSNVNVLGAAQAMALVSSSSSSSSSSSGDRDSGTVITGPPATADLTSLSPSSSLQQGQQQQQQQVSASESPLTPTHNVLLQQQQQQQAPPRKNYPYIDKAASPNVTALLGKTAYLGCRVKNLGDKTVSWVRHRDIHLLTVGRYTYTTDQRFRAIHVANTEDYTLMIKYPQHRDSGIYECQVSTTPHLSHYVHLSVVEPVTEVVGGTDLFIDRGSTINLTCTVKYSPEPPSYIIWNHNNAIISCNSPRGGVSVLTEKGETTTSYLLIQQAKPTDSGRYSCNPSNAVPHSILVHVLNGELPAAMQTGGQMPQQIPLSFCLLSSVILIFVTS